MLDTFRHFIHEDVCHIFDDILSSKLNTTPWVNLYGVEETEEELGFTLWAFEGFRCAQSCKRMPPNTPWSTYSTVLKSRDSSHHAFL